LADIWPFVGRFFDFIHVNMILGSNGRGAQTSAPFFIAKNRRSIGVEKPLKLFVPHPVPEQPAKCSGCLWGNWDGVKQFCSKQQCVREGDGP
jgi:hypothetical protein